MKESIEVTAKTVEEAIELALKELDANREEVEIDVVSRGRSGILGIGGEPAKVKATRISKPEDEIVIAQQIIERLLTDMKVSATAHLKSRSGDDGNTPVFEIEGEDSGLLIGRRGETMQSLQFLVNFIARKHLKKHVSVVLDVEGYRERRNKALRSLAQRMAERVVNSGRSVSLDPMSPSERRVIHMALADHPSVATESVGSGEGRRVTVFKRKSGNGSPRTGAEK